MFTHREICFAILFVVMGSIPADLLDFSKNETYNVKCKSNELNNGNIKTSCQMNNSFINITIELNETMVVLCTNVDWSDWFYLYNFTKYAANAVHFFACDLPKNNSLKSVTDFLGATDVEELYFHMFKNLTFERLHLKGFENLRKLDLSNNIISMDEDLLSDLPNLSRLYLRYINLHNITLLSYCTPKLLEIDLTDNNLELIELGTFDKFRNLIRLSLERNMLTKLESGIFDKLVELMSINLSSNNLVNLPEDIFGKLINLDTLNLAENNFTFLPRYLLQNNTNLRTINLSFNQKKLNILPNGFFRNLTKLEILNLEENELTSLPEDLLWGCFSLTNLTLNGNDFSFLPNLIFRDSKELLELKLDSNLFEKLSNYTFSNLTQLIYI